MDNQEHLFNAIQSPDDPRDYQAETIFPSDLSLPMTFDPRKEMLDVRDQGNQGSCVAESVACLKEIQEKKNVDFGEYMSPQFVYNHRENRPSPGMFTRDAVKILYKTGIVPEAEYPYGKIEEPSQIAQSVIERASNYKVKGYAFVNTIQTCKAAIFRSGGCIIVVPVYNMGKQMWKQPYAGATCNGMHAMTLVGWNDEGFIVRNSWGEQWGNGWKEIGYTIFPYSDWGCQMEVWTLIDDESSKPDPKYSKWNWKAWRAVKNTFNNMNTIKYVILVGWAFSIFIGITENPFVPLIFIGGTSALTYAWSKRKKAYLAKSAGS
jgi:C1A family cysteine protease